METATLSPPAAVSEVGLQAAWAAQLKEYELATHRVQAQHDDDLIDKAADSQFVVLKQLLDTAPPTIAAALEKLGIIIQEFGDVLGLDGEGGVLPRFYADLAQLQSRGA